MTGTRSIEQNLGPAAFRGVRLTAELEAVDGHLQLHAARLAGGQLKPPQIKDVSQRGHNRKGSPAGKSGSDHRGG